MTTPTEGSRTWPDAMEEKSWGVMARLRDGSVPPMWGTDSESSSCSIPDSPRTKTVRLEGGR